jgi:hypothetical protein
MAVYLIDDQYTKEHYPSLSVYNNKDINSTILLSQEHQLASDITEELYEDLVTKLSNEETLEEPYVTLLKYCQKYLLLLVVKNIYSLYNNKESEDAREYNISNIYGLLKKSQKTLKDYISDNDFTTIGDNFSTETYNYSPIFYPN